MYDRLDVDGKGYIGIQGNRVGDTVLLSDGTEVKFWPYLISKYPTIFSTYSHTDEFNETIDVLVVAKDPRIERINLNVGFTDKDVRFYRRDDRPDYVVPTVRMHEL